MLTCEGPRREDVLKVSGLEVGGRDGEVVLPALVVVDGEGGGRGN